MMKFIVGCCVFILLCIRPAQADEAGWALLEKVQRSVSQANFDSSFVILKGNQVESYRWLHGRDQQATVEHLVPMFVEDVDILRRNNLVYYLLSERPALITHSNRIKELPALLFEDISRLRELYNAIPGSVSTVDGRSAQLLRLSAQSAQRFHYWLWIDVQTGFPLRIDTLADATDLQNRALEIWQITQLNVMAAMPDNLQQLLAIELPAPASNLPKATTQPQSHQLNWVPDDYQLLLEPVVRQQLPTDISSYWLLSDGLHQISVFVQPANRLPSQAFRDGATTIYVHAGNRHDITVIGPVSLDVAQKLATAVTEK